MKKIGNMLGLLAMLMSLHTPHVLAQPSDVSTPNEQVQKSERQQAQELDELLVLMVKHRQEILASTRQGSTAGVISYTVSVASLAYCLASIYVMGADAFGSIGRSAVGSAQLGAVNSIQSGVLAKLLDRLNLSPKQVEAIARGIGRGAQTNLGAVSRLINSHISIRGYAVMAGAFASMVMLNISSRYAFVEISKEERDALLAGLDRNIVEAVSLSTALKAIALAKGE